MDDLLVDEGLEYLATGQAHALSNLCLMSPRHHLMPVLAFFLHAEQPSRPTRIIRSNRPKEASS